MFIIWGSTTLKKVEKRISTLGCSICDEKKLCIASFRQWFTFFFIPIFPTSSKKFYLACLNCQNCYKYKDDKAIKELLNTMIQETSI